MSLLCNMTEPDGDKGALIWQSMHLVQVREALRHWGERR